MKLLKILAVFGAIILQIGVFFVSWAACVMRAREMGRFPPTWFGEATFIFGFFWFAVVCICLSVFTAITRRSVTNWIAVFVGLAVWAFLVLPSDSSRPIAVPVFFAVGCMILLTGNGLLILYMRNFPRKSTDAMQQAEKPGKTPSIREF